MKTVLIEPTDVLFFRDAIPISAGQDKGASCRLPFPSTLHEAFRSSLLRATGETTASQRVILDADLAVLYGVDTGALKRAVKRNRNRFPADFMFQLTADELENLRCQFGISSSTHGGSRYLPYPITPTNSPTWAFSVPTNNSVPVEPSSPTFHHTHR